MKRWMIVGVVALAVVLIGGAGYLGLRSVREQADLVEIESPVTVSVTQGDVQQTVIAPGMLVDVRTVALGAQVGGWVAELDVRPGDVVTAGEVIARLQVDDLLWQIVQAESELDSARLALTAAEKARIDQIAQLELDLAAAQARSAVAKADHADALARAERTLSMVQEQQARLQAQAAEYAARVTIAGIDLAQAEDALARAQMAYKEALDRPWEPQVIRDEYAHALLQAEQGLTIAQARHDQANAAQATYQHDLNLQRLAIAENKAEQARLQDHEDPLPAIEVQRVQQRLLQLNDGVDPLLSDRVKQIQQELNHLQTLLGDADIVSPIDGVVLEVWARVGDAVSPGTGLVLLTDPAAVEAQTTVIEEDVPVIQVGQPAELFFDAQPDALIQGSVTRIVPQRVHGQDRPLYHVYLVPDGKLPQGLLPGMTVDASIVIARKTNVLRLPRALVRTRSDGTGQVRVWAAGQVETHTVHVGLRGDVYVEILDGLDLGDEVLGE
ncbi:MAG: efflux RND transporter periplasmic adaptor subunit [Anaerolineae bacterium]|nr:efflux RND transporter periplasmic adaptor subunit [Anaerolineae bacterium]